MKNKLFLLAFLIPLLSSCSVYTNTSDFAENQSSVGDLSFEDIENIKEYKSCSSVKDQLIFPPISDAVKYGGIKKIKMFDYQESKGIFGRNRCVIVYGE